MAHPRDRIARQDSTFPRALGNPEFNPNGNRSRQDQSGGGDPLHRAPRPGLEPENREGDVLVAASLPPLPPPSGVEPARVGRLRAVDATMEAREPADFSARRPGAEGTRWLRPGNPYGTAGLRHSDDAGQARPAGRRGRDAHPR